MRISPVALAYVRKRATALMVDICTVYHPGDPILNRSTGVVTRPGSVQIYTGACRLQEVPPPAQTLMGDEQVTSTQVMMTLPWDAPIPKSDDIVQVTLSVDTTLTGMTFKVVSNGQAGGLRASRKILLQSVESQKASW